jgi:chromosome segregation ATPase
MASLYDLTGDYAKFAEYMEQVELEPEMQEALEDALNNLGEDIEIKLENYAKIIKNFESDIAGLKAEEERLAKKRKAMENSIKHMKERMTEAMIRTGKVDIKGELFKFKVQANPPAVVMDVNYIEDVPEKYLIAQDPKIDKKKLAEDLKAGVELEGVAHLECTQGVRIR